MKWKPPFDTPFAMLFKESLLKLDIGKTNEAEQFRAHWHTNDGGTMKKLSTVLH